jgi:hypothetical protein
VPIDRDLSSMKVKSICTARTGREPVMQGNMVAESGSGTGDDGEASGVGSSPGS